MTTLRSNRWSMAILCLMVAFPAWTADEDERKASDPRAGDRSGHLEQPGDAPLPTPAQPPVPRRKLIVSRDGSFRIIGPEEKILIPDKAIHAEIFDQEKGVEFTVVYRDKDKIAWGKKIHIKTFIRGREYELIKGRAGRVDYLIPGHSDDTIHVDYVPRLAGFYRTCGFRRTEAGLMNLKGDDPGPGAPGGP